LIAGVAVNVVLAKLPFGNERLSKMTSLDQEYVIVNGWVLTRGDFAAAEMASNVVRF